MTTNSDGHIQLDSYDLRNTRDLRTLLLEAAYALLGQSGRTEAHVYLHHCGLAKRRVQIEFEHFHQVIQPKLGKRIRLHDARLTEKNEMVAGEVAVDAGALPFWKPSNASQEAVIAYLLVRYLQSLPGVGIQSIAEQTQASLPTIYAAIKAYSHCIAKDPEERTLRLHTFGQKDWIHWTQRSNRLSSVYFIDRSGAPRSASKLAKKLAELNREDLAIGGLMGAVHHLPALDATASPQLDIFVHGTRRADLSFVSDLDPGLELHQGRTDTANVVIHFIDRPASLFDSRNGQRWGSLPDCIANMQKAGMTHQVHDALRLIKLTH